MATLNTVLCWTSFFHWYAQCCYAVCRFAECRGAYFKH